MTSDLETKIRTLLSDGKLRDALEIARAVVGPKAYRKAANPTLYRMERSGKLQKHPPIKGMKPRWGLISSVKSSSDKQNDTKVEEVKEKQNEDLRDDDVLDKGLKDDDVLEVIVEDEDERSPFGRSSDETSIEEIPIKKKRGKK